MTCMKNITNYIYIYIYINNKKSQLFFSFPIKILSKLMRRLTFPYPYFDYLKLSFESHLSLSLKNTHVGAIL